MNTARSGLFTSGKVHSTAGNVPGLFLTEFGYFNIAPARNSGARAKKNTHWHTEATRASWLGGTAVRTKKGAFDRALGAKAKWLLHWDVTEAHRLPTIPAPPASQALRDYPVYGPDYGIIGSPAYTSQPEDIVGPDYGKKSENKPDAGAYRFPQPRRAYCAIRRWVFANGYIASPPPADMKNACPKPSSAHL
jgi:hypothetical protein